MKVVGKLDRVNPVTADESDPEVLAFAKAYLAGNRGNHRSGGPTARDEAASEKFHERYDSKGVRHGFAGSGTSEYADKVSGRVFSVDRRPNGQGFYGTSHSVEVIR